MTDKKKQGGPAYAPLPPRYYIFGNYDVWDKAQMLKYADDTHELRLRSLQANPTGWPLPHRNALDAAPAAKFKVGDLVTKTKGSQWKGRVVGTYSTTLTPEGYAVESSTERGSVQIYPAAALELVQEARAEQSAITSESGTPPAEPQAAAKAAPGEREQAAQRLRDLAGVPQDDVTDPFHPRYIEGYKAGHAAGRKRAVPQQEAQPNYVVSLVVLKEIPTGFNTQNKLYAVNAASSDEAVSKAVLQMPNDFPEHRLHTTCFVAIPAQPAPQPAPAPAPLSEREAFEAAWEKLHGKRPVLWDTAFKEAKMDIPAHSAGKYFYRDAQAAWKAWQARAALAAQGGK